MHGLNLYHCGSILRSLVVYMYIPVLLGAPVAQWVKRWPTDLADRSTLELKSSQP